MIENKCPSVTTADKFFGIVKEGAKYNLSQHPFPEEFGIYQPAYGTDDSFVLIYPHVKNFIPRGFIQEGILINKNGVFQYQVTKDNTNDSMTLKRLNRKTVTLTDDSIWSSSASTSITKETKDEILSADETVIDNGKSSMAYNSMWIGRFIQTTKSATPGNPTVYTALAIDDNYVYKAKLSVPYIMTANSTLTFIQVG